MTFDVCVQEQFVNGTCCHWVLLSGESPGTLIGNEQDRTILNIYNSDASNWRLEPLDMAIVSATLEWWRNSFQQGGCITSSWQFLK